MARAAADGRVAAAVAAVMPAEIMRMQIGDCSLVGWPGEVFVEFASRSRLGIRIAMSSAWPTVNCKDIWLPPRQCASVGTKR